MKKLYKIRSFEAFDILFMFVFCFILLFLLHDQPVVVVFFLINIQWPFIAYFTVCLLLILDIQVL